MSVAVASPKKVAKKPAKPALHPPFSGMVVAAITALKDRKGSSRQAILKYIQANYKVKENANKFVNQAIKKGQEKNVIKSAQKPGHKGAGSFRVVPVVAKKKPKKVKKVVKKKVKKPKKAKKVVKKKAAAKKPAAKKAKKPAAKKAAAPKKAAKKPAAKKAAKKPAKKAAPKKK